MENAIRLRSFHKRCRFWIMTLTMLLSPLPSIAGELSIASWNLGWHLSLQEAREWIAACNAKFALNDDQSEWVPDPNGSKTGWELNFGRDARPAIRWDISARPPCDVYKNPSFKTVQATEAAYRHRIKQISRLIRDKLQADVIAFQEVSGVRAVSEVLGNQADSYHVCSFSEFKVQRLAFAWRKSLGGGPSDCRVEEALSLPNREPSQQPRPGLSLRLTIAGKSLRFMNVHLKSSCVSPMESRGDLAGTDPNCLILQDQIVPLEQWLERSNDEGNILFGDFNRNLWHEANEPADKPVRVDTDVPVTEPLPSGARARNLLREVNDGVPTATRLALLSMVCDGNEEVKLLCDKAKRERLTNDELGRLRHSDALGCRNPVGLDHVLVSPSIDHSVAWKIPIGVLGRSRAPTEEDNRTFLAISDHCPVKITIVLP